MSEGRESPYCSCSLALGEEEVCGRFALEMELLVSLQAEVERQMMSQLKKQNVVINVGSHSYIMLHKYYHIYDINI